jgi:hypothetical protein
MREAEEVLDVKSPRVVSRVHVVHRREKLLDLQSSSITTEVASMLCSAFLATRIGRIFELRRSRPGFPRLSEEHCPNNGQPRPILTESIQMMNRR